MNRLQVFQILFILLGTILLGQEKLKVEYEVIPSYQTQVKEVKIITKNTYYNLVIDNEESEFTKIDRINNTQPEDMSGAVVIIEIGPSGTLYKNTTTLELIEDRLFIDKNFLIKDSLPQIDWKITKEKKEILGFTCYKANAVLKDNMKITAWYAPKLNFKTGPDKFWGLPGLILEVETIMEYGDEEAEMGKYTALKVNTFKSSEKIKIPHKGQEITEEAFQEYQQDFFKRQNEMYSSGVDKD